MHVKQLLMKGRELGRAQKALIMIHGRGANAQDIVSLSNYLDVNEYALIAPQATGNSWYPYSFLSPPQANEPWLSSALELIGDIVKDIVASEIKHQDIYFLGFSQGACLTLEFVTRNARRYGGVVAFTGGLIGDKIYLENYKGDFEGTPVLVASSDPDPHVPVQRVEESVAVMRKMKAMVHDTIYPGLGHTINEDEIEMANNLIFNSGPE